MSVQRLIRIGQELTGHGREAMKVAAEFIDDGILGYEGISLSLEALPSCNTVPLVAFALNAATDPRFEEGHVIW